LSPPRAALCAACDARFAAMIVGGGLDEAAALLARGLDPGLPAMKAVGVPELFRHLRGEIALAEAVAQAQQATRRYAKRQMTWFRHQLAADLTCDAQYSESFASESRHFIEHFLLPAWRSLIRFPPRPGAGGGFGYSRRWRQEIPMSAEPLTGA